MTENPVMSFGTWATNAELIRDVAKLGYLRKEWVTWDATYGLGTFWKLWEPDVLLATDLNPAKSRDAVGGVDFTRTCFLDRQFDCVVFDPPYKLNGRPTSESDERFGTEMMTSWRDRMDLIHQGLRECARVLGDGYLLVKCQDQVVAGKVRWQTDEITKWALDCGLGKKDRFDFPSYRPQPEGRKQEHSRRNTSTLLVFKRGWVTT